MLAYKQTHLSNLVPNKKFKSIQAKSKHWPIWDHTPPPQPQPQDTSVIVL